MIRTLLFGLVFTMLVAHGQQPGATAAPKQPGNLRSKSGNEEVRVIEDGNGLVGVNPAQPYRPIPLKQLQSRDTIFEFYFRALNPRHIKWGDVIEQRIATFTAQSIGNPYFRLCAFQAALIVILMMVCWLWWDKLRQVKVIAAESLTDAVNAKLFADAHALEAINAHNRHMDSCNRVIEAQESGSPSESARNGWRQEIDDLRSRLTREQAENARLTGVLQKKEEQQAALDSRLAQLEAGARDQHGAANAELVARLQRAESQLGSSKAKK